MQITPYPAGPRGLCVCFAWKCAKLKSRRTEGTYVAINLLQKLPSPRDFTKSILDSCPIHRFPTSPAEWEFKLTNLADIFHREAQQIYRRRETAINLLFLHCQQTSAEWKFRSQISQIFFIAIHREDLAINLLACVAGRIRERVIFGGGAAILFSRGRIPRGNSTRIITNPLAASPLAFTASPPKQKHSRAKSR